MKMFKILSVSAAFGAALALAPQAEAQHRKGYYTDAQARPSFAAFDDNRDGRIGRFEYRRNVSRQFAKWMRRVDRNRDGYLTGAERREARRTTPVAWNRPAKRGQPVALWQLWATHMDQARADFRRLDRNNNGFVSRREYTRRGRNRRVDRRADRRSDRRDDRNYGRQDGRRDDRRAPVRYGG